MKDLLHIVLDFISRFFFFQKHVILPLITYETWVEILQTYSADRKPRRLVFHFFSLIVKVWLWAAELVDGQKCLNLHEKLHNRKLFRGTRGQC